MDIKMGADSDNSCRVTISGDLDKALELPAPIFLFKDLKQSLRPIKGLRLDCIQWAIQEKMGFNLWWLIEPAAKPPKVKLILPIESRGFFDFEKITAIQSPPEAVGVGVTAFKVTEKAMTYLIMMDFTRL
jgi:hypothetical protein